MMLQGARRNRPQLWETGFIVLALAMGATLAAPVRAASKPTTVAEIALYRGPDRERLLIEGAKKEGQVTFYNSNTWMAVVSQEFEKKYPFVKVSIWRSDSKDLIKRIFEEYKTGVTSSTSLRRVPRRSPCFSANAFFRSTIRQRCMPTKIT